MLHPTGVYTQELSKVVTTYISAGTFPFAALVNKSHPRTDNIKQLFPYPTQENIPNQRTHLALARKKWKSLFSSFSGFTTLLKFKDK